MQSKTAALRDQINELDLLIQQGAADAQLNLWEMQRKDLNDQLQVALVEEVSQQERVQAQTEMVESITLAYDYNEILGNPLANETIIENIKQYRLQDSEEHYAEVARINAEWQNKIQEAIVIELDQKSRIIELQNELSLSGEEYDNLNDVLGQALIEKGDAEQKRDNAVRELAEANEELEKHKQSTIENCELRRQIEDLKQELTAKKALTVNGNDKLAELANKAKESTIAKANRGLERWNEQYGLDIPVLAIPELEPVTEVVEPVTEIPFQIETEIHSSESGLVDQSQSVPGEGLEEESEVITLESLHERLKIVEDRLSPVIKDIEQAVA